jgi:nitroimidazol reductase NimA-like FMN-containing flavoprotein (pyridoxamine 5'-phosphate oxidase superfamily)
MVIEEMTAAECRSMLAAATVARLGCALNNQPYIVPIHINLDGDFIYGYATAGQKIAWMRQNPLVCLELDEFIAHGQWASLVVFGHYEELPNTPHDDESRRIAERLFQRHPMWWEPASVPLAGHEPRTPVVFRIRIDRMTGRRATPAS